MKRLIILRGLPGSGKTTFATFLKRSIQGSKEVCADDCWDYDYTDPNTPGFTKSGIEKAHTKCFETVEEYMNEKVECIILHNTNTTEKEMYKYIQLANENNYQVVSLVVENRHESKSVHNVPEETLERMKNRFEIKL